MADRFPLILNTNANQIQEIASGDTLDLTGNNIKGVGVITATNISGNIIAGAGTSNIVAGVGTFTDLRVGGNTSFSEDLVVTGNARVTGILTVGTSSIILNDSANTIKVGTALTLGHTQGLQFHTQNLHSTGFEVNQINASGIITATGADINGDIDVDGHTNLDNVNIAGVTTFAQGISVSGSVSSGSLSIGAAAPTIYLNDNDANSDFTIQVNSGLFKIMDSTNSYATRLSINSSGNVSIAKDLDVDGHTNLDNVNIAGVVTATTFVGNGDFVELDVDGHTNLDNVSVAGVSTFSDNVRIVDNKSLLIGDLSNGDLSLVHDGNNSVIRNRTGDLYLANATQTGIFLGGVNGEVRMSYGGIQKFETTSSGITVTGNATVSGNLSVGGVLTYEDVTNVDSVGIVTARAGINLTGGDITLGDSAGPHKLKFGASGDFQLFHNGSNNYIDVAGDGHLYIRPKANFYIQDYTNGEVWIDGTLNGGVKLYYNGTKVIETKGYGLDITGGFIQTGSSIVNDNGQFKLGTGGDYKLYHDGSSSFMDNVTGDLYMRNSSGQILIRANTDCYISNYAANQHRAAFKNNGAVELYHAGNKKLETTSTGILMSGDVGISTTINSTTAGGVGIQRFWTASISAGNVYKCGQWYTNEGTVQLLINVRSYQPGHSGTTTYMYQGGYSAIGSTGTVRLLPLTSGNGHGNGPDTGENSNAWEVLIDNINNYTYAVYVHVPSGVSAKNIFITVTELTRGTTFTDLSSTVAYSSISSEVQANPHYSLRTSHISKLYAPTIYNDGQQYWRNSSGTNQMFTLSNNAGFNFQDNIKAEFGASGDLKIYHDGTANRFDSNGLKNMIFRPKDTDVGLQIIGDGGVELYYDNAKHFETTDFGCETVFSSGGGDIPIFKVLHGNRSQGIGLGYNTIAAVGSNGSIELNLESKGTLPIRLRTHDNTNMIEAYPGGEVRLNYNGTIAARTYQTGSRKALLVGDQSYINASTDQGELIVRRNLSSPNNASIEQCARMTIITNEQTAGGNGYGGAVFFGAQDVNDTNQYTYRLAAIGARLHAGADLANTTPNGDLSFFCQNSSLYERGRLRHDGYLFLTNTSIQSLSDVRLKENIEDYSFDLDKFKQFKPVTFNWKKPEYHSETPKSGKHRGFIAQDVQKLDSYALVNEYDLDKDSEERELIDEDGVGLTSTLGDKDAMYVSVIQQLIDKIEKLESEVAALKGS